MRRKAKNFFKTTKGMLLVILFVLAAIAAPGEGLKAVTANLAISATAAGLVDLYILRVRKEDWEFPSGAVLTAMIVTMVLRSQEPWYVPAITSVAAVLSQEHLRARSANVFNPASL